MNEWDSLVIVKAMVTSCTSPRTRPLTAVQADDAGGSDEHAGVNTECKVVN